jgi:hypothetical protein
MACCTEDCISKSTTKNVFKRWRVQDFFGMRKHISSVFFFHGCMCKAFAYSDIFMYMLVYLVMNVWMPQIKLLPAQTHICIYLECISAPLLPEVPQARRSRPRPRGHCAERAEQEYTCMRYRPDSVDARQQQQ